MIKFADDLVLLSQLKEAGSFTAASRLTGLTKSLLSRRLSELENRLGVRLIERSSRSFRVTDLGMQLCAHGLAIRQESDAALSLIGDALSEPTGALSIACPVVLAELIVGEVAAAFAERYPRVQVTFDVTSGLPNTDVDQYDLVFRASPFALPDSDRIARQILLTPYELVASPGWLRQAGNPQSPSELNDLEGVGWWQSGARPVWRIYGQGGEQAEISIRPRFRTNNLAVARMAALSGLGMARLPTPVCQEDLAEKRLARILEGYVPDAMAIYVVYPTRRSLTLSGRLFLKQLEETLEGPRAASLGAVRR